MMSTPAASQGDSGTHTTMEDSQTKALIQIGNTMESQKQLMEKLTEKLHNLEHDMMLLKGQHESRLATRRRKQ